MTQIYIPKKQYVTVYFDRILHYPLDVFPIPSIIVRIHKPMNILFSLSLIVVLIVVLIIKDLFVVGMATVRVK